MLDTRDVPTPTLPQTDNYKNKRPAHVDFTFSGLVYPCEGDFGHLSFSHDIWVEFYSPCATNRLSPSTSLVFLGKNDSLQYLLINQDVWSFPSSYH